MQTSFQVLMGSAGVTGDEGEWDFWNRFGFFPQSSRVVGSFGKGSDLEFPAIFGLRGE